MPITNYPMESCTCTECCVKLKCTVQRKITNINQTISPNVLLVTVVIVLVKSGLQMYAYNSETEERFD